MTGRRSRSARSAALAVLLAFGCSTGAMLGCSTAPRTTRHFLEDPPPSPDLVGKLRFHEAIVAKGSRTQATILASGSARRKASRRLTNDTVFFTASTKSGRLTRGV